jgi:parallel beta-helix repeat protein
LVLPWALSCGSASTRDSAGPLDGGAGDEVAASSTDGRADVSDASASAVADAGSSAGDSPAAPDSAGDAQATPDSGGADATLASDAGSPAMDGATGNPDTGAISTCATGGAGAHYVDATAGNDTADGTTPATAWRTIARVNGQTFQPGDSICFRAGGSWTGELHPLGSGSSAAPIVIDQYGTGAKPHIAAGTGDLQAVALLNQPYWEINNLEVTNAQGGPGDYRGIQILGRDFGVIRHTVIRNCWVHDVTGQVEWIGGSTADNMPPWVTFQAGWDASKRTGGIVFEITSAKGTPTWFDDVTVENNVVQDTSFGGIIFKQLDGGFGWGVRTSATDAKFTPHTNIVIRGNYVSQTNTKWGCNAFYITGSRGVTIEDNVAQNAGTSAIEVYNVDDVTIQRNEAFGTVKKAGGADFNGIDADHASTKIVIQYNYVHDNGDGLLLCQLAFGDSIARYNLIVDNSRFGVNLHSDPAATNQTYNNLFYAQGLAKASLVNTSGTAAAQLAATYALRNNIFFTSAAGDAVVTGNGVSYADNLYSGLPAAAQDTGARTGNPMFMNVATHPSGTESGPALDQLSGFKLKAGSPAINAGVMIANNGGADFWGTALYVGAPDIGPYEAP